MNCLAGRVGGYVSICVSAYCQNLILFYQWEKICSNFNSFKKIVHVDISTSDQIHIFHDEVFCLSSLDNCVLGNFKKKF